jgi:hypothetical protein
MSKKTASRKGKKMRKFSFILALVAILGLGFAPTAFAGHNDDCPYYNPNCNEPDEEPGTGDAGNVNTNTNSASGGDSSARAYGGDGGTVFGSGNSSSMAGGGDAGVYGSGNSSSGSSVGPVGNNSGNSDVSIGGRDSFSPDANAYSGVDFEDARFGNSRSGSQAGASADSTQGQQQGQGQMQGQLNLQGQDVSVGTTVGTTVGNDLSQGQSTATDNDQATSVDIDASDRSSTVYEDKRDPVASAAPVFASACSAGVSAQSYGFGGSLASVNPMCDLALAAEMARAVGNDELAYELTIEAAAFARARTNVVRRYGQWIPVLGQLF